MVSCSHCGSTIQDNFKYCPFCGSPLETPTVKHENLNSNPDNTLSEPPAVKKKPMPFWFKLIALLAILALVGVTAGILLTESWVDVVDYQLEALRQQDVEKAYHSYTSKEFQSTTSFDQFRHFVEAYPFFLNNQSTHFTERSIDHNIGTLRGNITSLDHLVIPIEYKLVKEEGKWKILSVRLLKLENIQNTTETNQTEELIETAKAQLKDIQDQKFDQAYQEYASKQFKEATSLESFKEFIKRYPIFTHYHVASFHKATIRNGVGTLSAILQSNQVAAYVKYYLIYENSQWKIWSLRILSPSENQEEIEMTPKQGILEGSMQNPLEFGAISLGDQVNSKGQIEHSTTRFQSNLKDLYVDIEIKNGQQGNSIYLNLQHVESGLTIPAEATIEESGDTLLMSVFSPPHQGWPKGHYQLIITASSDLKSSIEFEIE